MGESGVCRPAGPGLGLGKGGFCLSLLAAPDVFNDDGKELSRVCGRRRQGGCVAFLFFCFWPSLSVSHLKNVLEDVHVTVPYPN